MRFRIGPLLGPNLSGSWGCQWGCGDDCRGVYGPHGLMVTNFRVPYGGSFLAFDVWRLHLYLYYERAR